MIIKCQCREVDITKHPDLQREAQHVGLFCGRCRTTFKVMKVITVTATVK